MSRIISETEYMDVFSLAQRLIINIDTAARNCAKCRRCTTSPLSEEVVMAHDLYRRIRTLGRPFPYDGEPDAIDALEHDPLRHAEAGSTDQVKR